jgi:putative MFS transporter
LIPVEVAEHLHGWRHPSILAAAGLSVAAGFAQFAATAALPDVADAFGTGGREGTSLAATTGLSGTTLGIGLGVIRLASLGTLPISGLADRMGRRRVLLTSVALGLALTVLAAASPGFWWFVAIVALGRPLLSTTNAVAGVVAAEETRTRDRTWAIALVTAGYGIGAGLTALLRGLTGGAVGFRMLFALSLLPLAALPFLGRLLEEPARFDRVPNPARLTSARALLALTGSPRRQLVVIAGLTFAFSLLSGPTLTYLFLYAETVLDLAPSRTALAVVAAAPLGAGGLLLGRAAADRIGRVGTAAVAHAGVAVAAAITYSGTTTALFCGYLGAIVLSSGYAPAAGAIATELFPTRVRATVAGAFTVAGVLGAVTGLLAFGALADALGSFGMAAVVLAVPVLAATGLFWLLPETKGLELEQSAPE